MDPTTLLSAFAAALGILSAEAVLYSDTVNVHLSASTEMARVLPKEEVLEEMMTSSMAEIVATRSIFGSPSVQSGRVKTIGSVLARSLKLEDFAAAKPDR